jgi:hypothetical protein
MAVNVFKDKLVRANPWAVEDARRIVQVPGFDAARLATLAQRAKVSALAWIVADWMAREGGSRGWRQVREELGGDRGPRRAYTWVLRALGRRLGPEALLVRVATRLAGDDPASWIGALLRAARFELARRRID